MKPATPHRSPSIRNRPNLNNEPSKQSQAGALQPEAAGSAIAKPISSLGAQDVLALQRSVGNRATTGHLRSGGMSQPQTAISRTGPRIQRTLGKKQHHGFVTQHSTGKKFEAVSYAKESEKRKYFLTDTEDIFNALWAFEDDNDFDWIQETSEKGDTSLSELGDLSNLKIEQTNNNNNEESSVEKDILPLMMRPAVKLYMDQGCAGHLGQVQLFSGQFSTCSPVIMFNKETKIGGLYHYGAGPMDEEKRATLMKMIDFIKPTIIHVLQGATGGINLKDEELENAPSYMLPDWFHIKKFLQEIQFKNVIIDKDNKWDAVTVTLGKEDSALSISRAFPDIKHDLSNVKLAYLPEKFRHFGQEKIDKQMWF